MKIIRMIIGTVISIIALAIATKLAAMVLGIVSFVVALAMFVLKVALIVLITLFIIWGIAKILESSRRSDSY